MEELGAVQRSKACAFVERSVSDGAAVRCAQRVCGNKRVQLRERVRKRQQRADSGDAGGEVLVGKLGALNVTRFRGKERDGEDVAGFYCTENRTGNAPEDVLGMGLIILSTRTPSRSTSSHLRTLTRLATVAIA